MMGKMQPGVVLLFEVGREEHETRHIDHRMVRRFRWMEKEERTLEKLVGYE